MEYQRDTYPEETSNGSIDDDTDDFMDAMETLDDCSMDLTTALEESEIAIRKFFNNEFDEARELMKPWNGKSIYHTLGCAVFEFIPAVLTFGSKQIIIASQALKQTINLCNKYRRNYTIVESLGTIIKKPDFSQYTDIEAHAELCYAESLLLHAVLTFIEDEDLAALIKGTIKIKSCYKSYKDCASIIKNKTWESETSRMHFVSGVRMGIGSFNLMISLLPPRIISLLSFVGFNGNKAHGLAELEAGSREPGIRQQLCNLTLLGYNLILCSFIGANVQVDTSEKILNKQLELHPNGVWFLIFKGRLEFMRGQFDNAIRSYKQAIDSQDKWKQFHHMCYWELLWVHSMDMRWRESAMYCTKLLEDSVWSKTIYLYQKGAMMLQAFEMLTEDEKQHCSELMGHASYYKQRIAGKSLPMEKFVIKRCQRYQNQSNRLILPAVELMCLWNMFEPLSKNMDSAQNGLKLIEDTITWLSDDSHEWENGYMADNRALAYYLQGCLLRHLQSPRRAIQSLEKSLSYKPDIKEDTFLMPFALAEIGFCQIAIGEMDLAVHTLHDVKKRYSRFSLESRLHFRIHSKLYSVKTMIKNKE